MPGPKILENIFLGWGKTHPTESDPDAVSSGGCCRGVAFKHHLFNVRSGIITNILRMCFSTNGLQLLGHSPALLLESCKVGETKLEHKAKRHLGVFEHVVKRQVLDKVVDTVDVVIRVLKSRLDDEGRRVASLAGRGMVGASIAALGLNIGNLAVLDIMLE